MSRSTRPRLPLGSERRRSSAAQRRRRIGDPLLRGRGADPGWRTAANHRRYPRGTLRRIAIIKVAQRAGIPLEEIGAALATLPDGAVPSAKDWARLSAKWKSDLDDRIARLTRLRDQLSGCIGCGCLSLADCPLRNPADVLAQDGPGARILDPTA